MNPRPVRPIPISDSRRIAIDDAQTFARSWRDAWNSHDLDAVLSHFDDDVVFTSPVAASILPSSAGRMVGIDELRRYWQLGIAKIPNLHFEIVNVYVGLGVVVIHYQNHVGGLVNEVLTIGDNGLVIAGAGTYLAADASTASGVESGDSN